MLNVVVLISGSGSNLLELLRAQENGALYRIIAVGADVQASGLDHATSRDVPTFVVNPGDFDSRAAWGDAFAAKITEALTQAGSDVASPENGAPFLVVSAGLMRILPANFVQKFSPRLINTHPALLPLYPGAHAVRDALAAGATETGVTVHIIDEGVDTGPVLRQASLEIQPGESEADLHERIKQLERPLLVKTVSDIATGELAL